MIDDLAPFGVPWAPFGSLWGCLGLPLAPFGVPLGSLWPSFGVPLTVLGHLWDPFGAPWAALGHLVDFVENVISFSEQKWLKYCACAQNQAFRNSPPDPADPADLPDPVETVSGTAAQTPPPHAPGARMT